MTTKHTPKTREELVKLVEACIGGELFLQNIDTSRVTDMRWLFTFRTEIDWEDPRNDITGWDVSRVENMYAMFSGTSFDQDISGWRIERVRNMRSMFFDSAFSKDLFRWLPRLDPFCRLFDFNRKTPQEEAYGKIVDHASFTSAFFSSEKCKTILKKGSDKEKFEWLKYLKTHLLKHDHPLL